MEYRTEHDLLGTRDIPDEVYWGIQTLRATENFRLSNRRVPLALIRSIAMVKKACCTTNKELGYIVPQTADAIIGACDEIIEGRWDNEFPLDAFQGGAGTSTNMNANEVIANRALELMGYAKGTYDKCHPIEHVNLHQSTNDVYPTALKIAAISGIRSLSDAAARLQGAFQEKETAFASIVTIGRTELQDAVPITLGAQFSSFAEALTRDRWRTYKCEERLRVINLGGTAVGTGMTAPRQYIFKVIEHIRRLSGFGLTRGENAMDQTANMDALVEVSGILDAHAATLVKIANDLRLLHFAGEIILPPVQPGSTIMPGKVNPVILESAISAGLTIQANHGLLSNCASRGSFQINEFLPLIAVTLLESIELLTNTDIMMQPFVENITANDITCARHANRSPTLITAFVPYIGYTRAEMLANEFTKSDHPDFRTFLEKRLGVHVVEQVLSSANVMALGHREGMFRIPDAPPNQEV